MNTLTKTLFGGAALCALMAIPAAAGDMSGVHFTALHGGRVVNKTKYPSHGATHTTYTFGIYTYISGSDHKKQRVMGVESCTPGEKISVTPKKTQYGKIGISTETLTNGCEIIEPTYKVLNPPIKATDNFVMSVVTKHERSGTRYKNTLNIAYTVTLE